MKKTILAFLFIILSTSIYAGHHFDSKLSQKNPQLDLTDIFVFKSKTPGKTVFIMAFNPTSKKDSLSNYSSKGIYRFCIGAESNFSTGISPTFTFKNNKIQFYLANEAEPAISTTGNFIGEGPINRKLEFSNGINIWTGTALDLFQGNSSGLHAFKEKASKGIYDLSTFNIGEKGNIFNTLPSTIIVLEMPNEMLPKNIHYYAATSLELEKNHWHRINRISYVLFPHLYLLDDKRKIKYLNSNHEIDEDVKKAIYDNVLHYVTISGLQKDPKAYTDALIKKIYPDVLTYTIGSDAEYTINKINGRPLEADAMNIALALLVGSEVPIDDKVSVNLERFQNTFPYVVPIDNDYVNTKTDKVVKIEVPGNNTETKNKYSSIIWYVLGGAIFLVILVFILNLNKSKK